MANADYFQHEKTVNKLLADLEVKDIPQITVYNKRDIKHPDFVPTTNTPLIFISAYDKEDRNELKRRIEKVIIEMMEQYQVSIPSTEGKLLAQLKNETIVRELVFDEEKEIYQCRGFSLPDHQISGQIEKYKSRME